MRIQNKELESSKKTLKKTSINNGFRTSWLIMNSFYCLSDKEVDITNSIRFLCQKLVRLANKETR